MYPYLSPSLLLYVPRILHDSRHPPYEADGMLASRGLWIFRGSDIPPIMQEECVDLELYDWKKVDLSDSVSTLVIGLWHALRHQL